MYRQSGPSAHIFQMSCLSTWQQSQRNWGWEQERIRAMLMFKVINDRTIVKEIQAMGRLQENKQADEPCSTKEAASNSACFHIHHGLAKTAGG